LLPAKAGTCPECATAHSPEFPHNAQSLHYQYAFFEKHGRWPNWKDAVAHCAPELAQAWIAALIEKGVDVEGGGVNPAQAPAPSAAAPGGFPEGPGESPGVNEGSGS
jgi:hypothetical protein